ncbi:MAG: hypothetical protein AMJ70_05440 [Dehalococcoidia bacterium SG8_51_3]|nr:MAG: hypothetical protein AMJ70_05440 [Dehalococcoidia bacterium SG8_51_3]
MAEISNKLMPEIDETEEIFKEYRQGISQAIDKVRTKLLDQANQEAREIVAKANDEANTIVSKAQNEADTALAQANSRAEQIIKDAEDTIKKANDEASAIVSVAQNEADTALAKANSRAEQVIKDAEETIKKEARYKTQKEEEKFLREARSQSERIIAAAKQSTEKLYKDTIDNAKKEADILTNKLTEDSKKEADSLIKSASEIKNRAEIEANLLKKRTEEEARSAISDAREEARRDIENRSAALIEKARQEAEDLLTNAKNETLKERDNLVAEFVGEATKLAQFEKIKILSEAKSKAEYIVREIKARLNSELEKSSLLINGAQERLTGIMTEVSDQIEKEQFDIDTSEIVNVPEEELSPDFTKEVQDNMLFSRTKDEERNYEGRLELTILAPIDVKQKKDLEKLLAEIPNLQMMADGGSSDGSNWLELELNQSIPLVSMLKQMPPVRKVASHGNNIIVALKHS